MIFCVSRDPISGCPIGQDLAYLALKQSEKARGYRKHRAFGLTSQWARATHMKLIPDLDLSVMMDQFMGRGEQNDDHLLK